MTKHQDPASIPILQTTNADENLAMNLMRKHFVMVLAILLFLGAAALAQAKGPLTDLPQTPSGWRPIPLQRG